MKMKKKTTTKKKRLSFAQERFPCTSCDFPDKFLYFRIAAFTLKYSGLSTKQTILCFVKPVPDLEIVYQVNTLADPAISKQPYEKQWGLYQNKVTPSLASNPRSGHLEHNCKMAYW